MLIAMEGPTLEDTESSAVIRQACEVKNYVEAVRKVIKDVRLAIAPGPTIHWLFRSHDLP